MIARKIAAVILVFVVAGGIPMSAVAVQDTSPSQAESEDEPITVSELNVVVIELDNVTVQNLSIESLNVSDPETDEPSSIEDRTVTVSATLRDVRMENVTIRNQSLAERFLGADAQSLQERAPNETIETGRALANVSLSNTTIDGAVFETVLVRNATGNVSFDNASTGNQTGDGNETSDAPEIEATNVTIGDFIASDAADDEAAETPTNATEAAEGGASDVIIGDENVTQPSWANKTGGNETDVTGSGNWTTGTPSNGTQLGGEVGEDLTAGNESTATPAGNATESPTPGAADTPAGNATESPSGNASLSFER